MCIPVIALLRPDQHRILKLIGVGRGAINLAAELTGLRLRDRYEHHARVQLVERQYPDGNQGCVAPQRPGEPRPLRAREAETQRSVLHMTEGDRIRPVRNQHGLGIRALE